MELVTANKERQEQLWQLREDAAQTYRHLKIAYDTQTKTLEKYKQDLVGYKQQANYWQKQFKQIQSRETELTEEIEELKAQLKKREQQLFGRKSEKKTSLSESTPKVSSKPRGQQKDSKGHGKRDYSDLPIVEETHELPEQEQLCPDCGLSYEELSLTEDSDIVELINVKAYVRKIKRKKYKSTCRCERCPKFIDAPVAPKLFPKSRLGITVWAHLLLQKYEYQQPINRVLKQLEANQLSLATGTVTDGLRRCIPLLMPVYDAVVQHNLEAKHWHADETGWKVFEAFEGKKSQRWYMWIFQSKEAVVFKICPSRSSAVVKSHFGTNHEGGLLSVDRYSAYKAIAKCQSFLLAFCWAHVRRDFLTYAKGYTDQENWALTWVKFIANLYHINNQRVQYRKTSKTFRQHHQKLIKAIDNMRTQLDTQLNDDKLRPSAKKLLKSLDNHWDGLTIFVDEPDIPMDNNTAERGLRHAVIGRNNYYGSGAIWSSELAAMVFTLFRTMKLWKLNIHTWLLAYLHECSCNQGQPPTSIEKFLPWNMSEEQRKLYSKPPEYESA